MAYEETKVKIGHQHKKAVAQVLSPPSTDKKAHVRKQIEEEVFDTEDSLADTAKWVSILTTYVIEIYKVLPDAQKDAIPADKRATIESISSQFEATETRLDVQLKKEGIEVVERMITRQQKVGEIVDKGM